MNDVVLANEKLKLNLEDRERTISRLEQALSRDTRRSPDIRLLLDDARQQLYPTAGRHYPVSPDRHVRDIYGLDERDIYRHETDRRNAARQRQTGQAVDDRRSGERVDDVNNSSSNRHRTTDDTRVRHDVRSAKAA